MKHIIILYSLFLSLCFFSCSKSGHRKEANAIVEKTNEEIKNDQPVFEKVIDSFNYKLAVYALETSNDDSSAIYFQQFQKAYEEYSSIYRRLKLAIPSNLVFNRKLCDDMEALKKGYPDTILSKRLVDCLLDTSLVNNQNKKFYDFFKKRKSDTNIVSKFITPARVSLNDYLEILKADTSSAEPQTKGKPDVKPKTGDTGTEKSVPTTGTGLLRVVFIIVALLVGCAAGFFVGKKGKSTVRAGSNIVHQLEESNAAYGRLYDDKQKLEKELNDLKAVGTGLTANTGTSVATKTNSNFDILPPSQQSVSPDAREQESDLNMNILYFPPPGSNNFFMDSQSSKIVRSTDVYQLQVQSSGKAALFFLIEDPRIIQRAIDSPDTYLESVSDLSGVPYTKAKHIKTIEKGQAIFDGNKWTIVRPVKIELS